MKPLSWILMILCCASVAAAVAAIVLDRPAMKKHRASADGFEQQLEELKEELKQANFKYRGLRDSATNIPDSLKTRTTGTYMRKHEEYRKQVFRLERKQRDLNFQLGRQARALSEIQARLKRRVMIVGAAAVLFLAGAILAGRAAIRS